MTAICPVLVNLMVSPPTTENKQASFGNVKNAIWLPGLLCSMVPPAERVEDESRLGLFPHRYLLVLRIRDHTEPSETSGS